MLSNKKKQVGAIRRRGKKISCNAVGVKEKKCSTIEQML